MALAGNADPLAGQPDMDALSEFLLGNWVDLLGRGMIKAPPKGSILQVRGELSSADPCITSGMNTTTAASAWYS